ncbi:MAG: helix-turn-helix domain-containing protein [bacterium]
MSKQKKNIAVGVRFNEDLPNLLLRMCKVYSVSQKDIRGRSNRKILVTARKAFAYFANLNGASFSEIGAALGNRDNNTIIEYLGGIRGINRILRRRR